MPSNVLDFRQRAQLTEHMDGPCTRDELRACLRDLALVNRLSMGYRPQLHWLNAFVPPPGAQSIHILDVGCGYGDGLRRIERWAHARGIALELTGLDINPDTVAIAAEASMPASAIRWVAADVFTYTPHKPVHLVISSLFTHHLSEPDVIRFLQWMEQHAQFGWFINDLSRAAIPYHLLQVFSRLARLHPFVQHDGPVSIARSFVPQDWQRMCVASGLDASAVSIQAFKPARLCVSRRKPQ
jgi:SAM-dependent methyltransferase